MTFRVLVADPPWQFDDALPGPKRGAGKHYATMRTEDICALRLPELAPGALLFLWRVASMLEDAVRVCRAWGFRPVSEVTWCKTTREGRPHIGMGRYVRNAHEGCLVGARKGSAASIVDHGVPSWFMAPRGRHSEKPREFYELVERLAPAPYVELFARAERPGWTCLGNELGNQLRFGLDVGGGPPPKTPAKRSRTPKNAGNQMEECRA